MPHLGAFFRSHSLDLPTELKHPSKKSLSSSKRPSDTNRSPSSSGSSLASFDGSVKMLDHKDHKDHKRLSLAFNSPKSSANKLPLHHPSELNLMIESPPLVFYGPASSSTGALLSGQLIFNIEEPTMAIESFTAKLALEVTRKKPFHGHCPECAHQDSELTTWKFLAGPTVLNQGEHSFPFSFLLPGHLPATMKGGLSSIDYVLRAVLTPKTGEPIHLTQSLDVKRAIQPPDTPRNSIRIFPPTNLTANCHLPSVIHPIGQTMVSMRIDGTVSRNVDTKTQTQWRLKRLTWRLDETQKTISPACTKHAVKFPSDVEEGKKGMPHQDVRTLGTEELKTGWKSDYTTADGTIELEFPMSIRPELHPICDMKAADGTEVSHILVVEMIVAEEWAPIKKPTQVTPTGAARVLRMHFTTTVTERAGLGISWDEEQPPLYENVPASPPVYGVTETYEGAPLPDYEDLEPLDPRTMTPLSSRTGTPAGHLMEHPAGGNGEGSSGAPSIALSNLSQEL